MITTTRIDQHCYDLYRISASKSGKALPANAELLPENATLKLCDSPSQTR